MITPDQVAATYKSNVDSFFALSAKTFEGFEKLVDLNVNVAKATQAEVAEKFKEAIALRDPQELVQFSVSATQPAAEKAIAYTRHVGDITKLTYAEYLRFIEAQVAEGNRRLVTLIDSASKNAPTGSESAFAMLKSAVAAANSAMESAKKASQQFADITEANLAAATNATVKAAGQAASVTKMKKAA